MGKAEDQLTAGLAGTSAPPWTDTRVLRAKRLADEVRWALRDYLRDGREQAVANILLTLFMREDVAGPLKAPSLSDFPGQLTARSR